MKHLIKTMAFTLLGLVLSMNLWGATETYTHDFTTTISSGGDITLSTITWTASNLSSVGGYNSGNYKGIQIGTSSATGAITLTSKNDWGAQSNTSYFGYTKVKKVYVWMNAGAKGSIAATVTIGGKSATSDGTEVAKNSSATSQRNGTTKVTFTPASDGETGTIVIAVSKATAKQSAGYLCAIQVECETAPAAKIDVTLSRNGEEQELKQQDSPFTLPTDEDPACEGWEFKGWSTSSVTSTTTTPTFVTQATATGTYYAVYGKTESGSGTAFSKYEQVSLEGTIADGQYLISTGSYTMAGSGNTGASFSPGTTEATAKEYTITTLGSGVFTIKGPDNNYIGGANGTGLTFSTTTPSENAYKWKYTSNGIQNQAYTTRYIKAYNTTDFRHYTTSNGTTTYLYKRVETSGSTTTYTSSPECAEAGKTLISYDKNTEDEATGDIPASVEQDNGVAYTVSSATLTRSGYNFVGWNTNKDATEGISTIPAASITGSAITLYAIWQAKTVQSVVVSGTPTKTNYEAGETFDPAGLTVTINYGDEQVVVTEGFVWAITPDNGVLTKGQTSVNATATALGTTSAPYEVTGLKVTAAALTLTWDLSKVDDELTTATENKLEWTNAVATMTVDKGESSTNANNYYPGTSGKTYTSTRFYASSVLTIAPVDNNTITKVEFTATQESYATALKGSTWTNASASVSNTTLVTVTPTDGTQAFSATIGATCGFTAVKVYYQPGAELASIAVKTAPSKVTYNAGESFTPDGLVITATYSDASTKDITYDANDTKWEFIPELTEKLTGKDDAVAITYNGVTIDPFLDIIVNRIASNLTAVSATKILVVEDMPDVTDWYTIDDNYDGTVAFSSDNTDVFDVEEGTGFAYAAGTATLTITAPQTDTYKAEEITIEVTVNAAAVPCSVKWMNNGDEYTAGDPSTVVNAGQKVTKLPTNPTPCDAQHVFKGWTNAAITTPQADAPAILFTDAASAPTVDADNTVYYAVYAVESIDEDIDSYTFTGVGTVTEGVTTLTTSSGNTIKMDKGEGSNNPAWSSNQARLYAYGVMTVSSSDKINKVVYTYKKNASNSVIPDLVSLEGNNSDAGSHNSETDASNVTTTTWTSSTNAAKAVTMTLGGTKGNYGFTNVTIYTAGELVYSDYSTSCAAIELDKIELSGTYPTTFLAGDAFSHEGMTITASYTNSTTTKNVTNLATFTDKATGEAVDMSAVGSKTILVSYTEDENTKTAEYDITINDWPNKTIQEFITAQGTKCYLTAFVSNLNGDQYDLTDNSGTIHGYKYSLATGVSDLANGDRIRVKAEEYTTFQNAPEVKNIIVLEKLAYSAIAISGEMTTKEYVAGNKLSAAGLVVKGKYADEEGDPTHVISNGITWNLPEAVLGTSNYNITATVGGLTTPDFPVTVTVKEPKVLKGITISNESTQKTNFLVGENFTTTGLKVIASFDGGYDDDEVTSSCTFSRTVGSQFTDAVENETITVSYKEGDITKTATYTINATWMTLADLVKNVTPTGTAVQVWVKITDALVKVRNNSYLTTDVTYGENQTKEVKIYKSGVDAAWVAGGTISGELKDVDWKLFNSDWELMPSDWSWATYTPAAPTPVTGVSLNESAIDVKVGKTVTLVATVAPDNATDKSVTWSIVNDNASGKITVSDAGVVSAAADATVGATATVQVKTTDGGFTATCTVTVTETPKCEISYYVKGSVASTQNIAREEEGTLTYEPELVVAGYTFAGWAEAAIAEETATATLISTYTPGADEATKNVYAVFIRVDDSSPTYQQYAKVTSALTDWAGDYLLVYENEGTAYVWTGVDAASCYATATIDGNVISSKPDGASSLTIAAMTDGYSILVNGGDNNGKYIGKNASGNGMDIGASAYKNTISISENSAIIAGAGGSTMRYNSASDQLRFRYYGSGQKAVQLYKYDAGSVMYTSNPVAKVKVTFNLDGGVGGCGTITVNEGEDAVLCGDAPTKDLYKFKAWSDGVNEYAAGATIENVTEDIELKALWIAKKQYTISFNKGGAAGTTPDAITDYEYNEVTLPAQGDLSNPGYIFGGWNDGEITYAGGATFTMPEKNVSMTAVWVAKTNDKWYLVTSAEQLAAGKQYAIVSNEKGTAMGAMVSGKTYMANVSASFNADKSMMIAIDPSAVILTLGGNATDGWTLSNNSQYLGSGTVKEMAWSTEVGDDYKWEITIADGEGDYEAEIENTVGYLCYNATSPRFTTYSSVQSKVQLYVLVPAKAIDEEVDASTLDDHADVTVNEGGNLLIDAPKTLGDIYVMEGGKVTISGTATLTVNNFVIKSTMGAGQSGQVLGVTSTNFTITGSAYYDVVLGDNGNPEKWHAFAVPFNVDAINGVYDLDDNKLTNEVNYAIMDYHGDVRAKGQYGWKKFRGIMTPGVFYLMTVDGLRTTYRMKMNGGFHASSSTISVQQYAQSGAGTEFDAGWNGIANNQLSYSSVAANVQVLNPVFYTFETMTASTYNFTVGTPFFYQASGDGTITMAEANASEYYAPRRVGAAEAKNIAVTLGNDNYTDRLYISATDEATNEYQIGRDLVKMTMTNAPAVPQIFAEAYGTKLCMVDVPMMNDEAVYALNLYAPANGEYTIGAAQVKGYEVFLTQYGSVIWNLSMSEATIELTKGNNTEYGLILKATSGHAPTDINTINGQESVQKFLYNSNIYLRHNNNTFNVQGQLVK